MIQSDFIKQDVINTDILSPFSTVRLLFLIMITVLVKCNASRMRVSTLKDSILDWSDSEPTASEETTIHPFTEVFIWCRCPRHCFGGK